MRPELIDACNCIADRIRQYGSLGMAERQAESQGQQMLNTAVRKQEAEHQEQDKRIEKVAKITPEDKVGGK